MVERGPFLEQDGGSFAWVVEGGSATRRPIQAGASSLSNVEIVSGLEEGDRIVVSGTDQFGNAEQVRINGECPCLPPPISPSPGSGTHRTWPTDRTSGG